MSKFSLWTWGVLVVFIFLTVFTYFYNDFFPEFETLSNYKSKRYLYRVW